MELTQEQLDIIHHDLDKHATVLAVAGSGKTLTMVYRIRHLVGAGVQHNAIRAVMYNRSAREDFDRKLHREGLGMIKTSTFHSLGYQILIWAGERGYHPQVDLVEDAMPIVKKAIGQLRMENAIDKNHVIDPEEVLGAISTWKSMLTLPVDAGHLADPIYVTIYERFERIRHREKKITFDDQIFDAVLLLEQNELVRGQMENKLEHLIIDEFQDVNLSRLRLAQILAGNLARVMVVGDDDQCIYEWQGARSSYIKRGFETTFTHFPHSTYKLSSSFRFGAAISQIAANVIGHNSDRVEKDLVAHSLLEKSSVELYSKHSTGGENQIPIVLSELFEDEVLPKKIVILVRKYSQSFSAQLLMFVNGIPFYVDGQLNFFEGFAVKVALDYLDIALALDKPLTHTTRKILIEIINRPNRFVRKENFARYLDEKIITKHTISQILLDAYGLLEAGISERVHRRLRSLERSLRKSLADENRIYGGEAILSLLDDIDFKSAFSAFKDDDKASEEVGRIRMLGEFLVRTEIPPEKIRKYLSSLDTQQGKNQEDCICITSVFRAKGLEWDNVLLPGLIEGQCPDLRATVDVCVNINHPNRTLDPTETLESERRLFYVAVTRARKKVFLFADCNENQLLSRFVHEAYIADTVDAVCALQELVDSPTHTKERLATIKSGAVADARLREGLLKMIRRFSAMEQLSGNVEKLLEKAAFQVNACKSVPFSYPQAYPDAPVISGPQGKDSRSDELRKPQLGLPF